MNSLLILLKRYSYPILGLLLLLFAALFYTVQGVESKQHITYLQHLQKLEHDELSYNMELYRSRFNLNSDFDQLVDNKRSIDQLLLQLASPPQYLDLRYQHSLPNLVKQLQVQYQEKNQHASQFKTAKALFSNSARYLPQLHIDVENLSTDTHHPLIDQIHYLAEEVLTYIANQTGNHEARFLQQITQYRKEVPQHFSDNFTTQRMLHGLLRHMELIISNLPAMEQHLKSASTSVAMETITHLRDLYLAGYRQQQNRTQLATQLLSIFTLALFTALFFAVFNLRHTQDELEQSNLELEHRVTKRTAELSNAKAYAEKITASMSEALMIVDSSGLLTSCNPAAERLLGYNPDEIIGTPLEKYINAPILEAVYTGGEGVLLSVSNKSIPVQISRATLYNSHKAVSGFTFVIHDLTERKHTEEQRQFLAFQSGLAEMGITVMHNIGNIITGITGHVEQSRKANQIITKTAQALHQFEQQITTTLKQPSPSTVQLTTLLRKSSTVFSKSDQLIQKQGGKINHSLNKVAQQTQQIGALIKLHEQDIETETTTEAFDLHTLVEDVLSSTRPQLEQQQVTTEIDLPDELPLIDLPRNQLLQMTIHLMHNSIEAIHVRKQQEPSHSGKITIQIIQKSSSNWCLRICDNGCGIPQSQQEDIFHLGFSTHHNKSGYGLHSVGTFLQSKGGKIEVESEGENSGSCFTASFPL